MEVDLGFCYTKLVPRQRPLRDRKNKFRSFSDAQSSTHPANFVKIGLEDVEMIGLTEITWAHVCVRPSITSRCSIETAEQIELFFGM